MKIGGVFEKGSICMTMQATHLQHTSERPLMTPLQVCRIAAVTIAILIAVGVMAGESWVLENAPVTLAACEIGQASDLTRALDSGIAALTPVAEQSAE
jgi:hypothetical protein